MTFCFVVYKIGFIFRDDKQNYNIQVISNCYKTQNFIISYRPIQFCYFIHLVLYFCHKHKII